MVNSELRRHKLMEKAIKKLMAANLPPTFKFKDTYDSIEVPAEYQQHLPTQSQLEAEFDALIEAETLLPTTTTDIENLDIISANVYSNTATGRVGIGTASPAGTLHVHSSDSIIVPSGTTAQRNSLPINGMLRHNSQTGYLEVYTPKGWGSLASPPTITSLSPSAVTPAASNGTVLTINGSLFDQNASVELRNESGDLYSTSNPAFTNSGLITATLGSLALGTYTVIVTNGSGLSVDSTSTFSVNDPPVWNSPADGATLSFSTSSSTTITLSATDPGGSAVTYSLVSGTLPSGLTLSGNTISGTSGAAGGTSTQVTIRASDGTVFTDRSFTIETAASLYPFTSHTFTNTGLTGRTGPTLTQLRTAYSGVSWSTDTNYLNVVTQGIQEWTVPQTANYTFTLGGSRGGEPITQTTPGGYGALVSGTFYLQVNTILKILVGQTPIKATGGSNSGGAGGGGTFVTLSDNTPLFVAGGGGGCANYTSVQLSNLDGQSTAGDPYYVSIGRVNAGGGGGSFYSNSTNANWGRSFVNGGEGGTNSTDGGFGGGGGSYYANAYAAGGGGYSGGDETDYLGNPYSGTHGGGGGSFASSSATSVSITRGGNTSTLVGFVTITKI